MTWAALAIVGFAMVPLLAHMLRRRPPTERPFAGIAFVPAQMAEAQQKAAIEDRALLAIRISAVCMLAVLGATPLIRCDSLSLARPAGASVAVVVVLDDSASMRAQPGSTSESDRGATRFSKAKQAAQQLLGSLRSGDVVALVLAGRPVRVALAPSRDFATALRLLEERRQSDRATDLAGALHLAEELLRDLPQVDKRVVLLSDRADGASRSSLAVRAPAKLWVPLAQLGGDRDDCAVLRAERRRGRIEVATACHRSAAPHHSKPAPRHLQLRRGTQVMAQVPVVPRAGTASWSLTLPQRAKRANSVAEHWNVVLTGSDAVAANDEVPVMAAPVRARVGVVSDASRASVVTGGAPPVEKGLSALGMSVRAQPLASVPDRRADFDGLRALVVDDVPGLTPAQRRELAAWLDRGGVLLLALGPRAAAAPLGAGFSSVLDGVVRWEVDVPEGATTDADRLFGTSAKGLVALSPKGRARLALGEPGLYEVVSRWEDGEPLVWRKRHGRGMVIVLGLPLSVDASDFVLRPAFLVLLQHVVDQARSRGGVGQSIVGAQWLFPGYRDVRVHFQHRDGGELQVEPTIKGGAVKFSPPRVGRYRLELDGEQSMRTVTFDSSEVDMRPRPYEESASASELGSNDTRVDVSAYVALALLLLLALELALRLRGARLGWGRRKIA